MGNGTAAVGDLTVLGGREDLLDEAMDEQAHVPGAGSPGLRVATRSMLHDLDLQFLWKLVDMFRYSPTPGKNYRYAEEETLAS